jgi:hypothetical protein
MPKGARRTIDQKVAAAEAMLAKAKAEMDRQAIPLGYMVKRGENLPTELKRALKDILFRVNDDKGDRERLLKVLGLPSEVQVVAPSMAEVAAAEEVPA